MMMATVPPASTSASPTTTMASNFDADQANNNYQDKDKDGVSEMSIDQPPPTPQLTQQPQHQNQQSPEKQHQPQQSSSSSSISNKQRAGVEQKRPMNAFLLFCKQQRSLVREKHPKLENREITRILGDWWSKLDKEQKSKYTDQARQYKQAFMEANPDFKWCKTTISVCTNSTNNNNNTNSNTNNDELCPTNNKNNHHQPSLTKESSSLLPSLANSHQSSSSSSNSTLGNNRQHEAPKPPKKRYLERNETINSGNNNYNPKANNYTNSNSKDNIVPYLSLDQAMLDRVIESALSDRSNDSPAGLNMCKNSNRDLPSSNNWTSKVDVEQKTFEATTISASVLTSTTTTASTSSSSHSNGEDEPVDFSMKLTIRATNQSIIDRAIEQAYAGSVGVSSGTSRSGDVGNVRSQFGPPNRGINAEVT